jgi:hypothetical protein
VQAQVDQIYVASGIRLPNEVREDHGWEKNPALDERKLAPPRERRAIVRARGRVAKVLTPFLKKQASASPRR